MADLVALLDDLDGEGNDLERFVVDLPPRAWATPTPSQGWTIAHQIAHLTWTDEASLVAVNDPEAFASMVSSALADIDGFVDKGAAELASLASTDLLARWRAGRKGLTDALNQVPDGTKLAWFGPPMSAASMATARLMETWAHGQDVVDALGEARTPTARLRNVAHIGVRTRDFAFASNGIQAPADPFRVELDAPDGQVWAWGPDDAVQRISGPALDFCLLVTQRRHLDDLALVAEGCDAALWLTIAQVFAGPPGSGRTPGQFERNP